MPAFSYLRFIFVTTVLYAIMLAYSYLTYTAPNMVLLLLVFIVPFIDAGLHYVRRNDVRPESHLKHAAYMTIISYVFSVLVIGAVVYYVFVLGPNAETATESVNWVWQDMKDEMSAEGMEDQISYMITIFIVSIVIMEVIRFATAWMWNWGLLSLTTWLAFRYARRNAAVDAQ